MYQEYFDYSDCTVGVTYTNYTDICVTTHSNTANYCATVHENYGNWSSTTHGNYTDTCTTSYGNAMDNGTSYTNYTNHSNYSNPDTAIAQSDFTWNHWNKIDIGNVDLNVSYITDSIDSLKELRDNLKVLLAEKGQNTVEDPTSVLDDSTFDDGDPATIEKIKFDQYNELKDRVERLWTKLKGTDPGFPDRGVGEIIGEDDFKNLSDAVSDLRANDLTSTAGYANVVDYLYGEHTNHSNYRDS